MDINVLGRLDLKKIALQLIISISLDPGVGAGFTLPSEDVMKWLATN